MGPSDLHLQCSLVLTFLCCFIFGDSPEDGSGAEEMAQQAKVLVIVSKPDGLNLISGTHMRKGRTDSHVLSSDLHTYSRPPPMINKNMIKTRVGY